MVEYRIWVLVLRLSVLVFEGIKNTSTWFNQFWYADMQLYIQHKFKDNFQPKQKLTLQRPIT